MSEYTLRPARPNDEAAVTALLQRSYATLMAPDYDPDTLAKALPVIARANPKLLDAPTYYVVETPDGRMIGCGGWTPEKPGSGEVDALTGHIRHFATDPDFIRRGVGRALIQRSLEDARAQGFHSLHCYSSLSAVAFYASCGFRDQHAMDIPLSDECLFTSRFMVLDL